MARRVFLSYQHRDQMKAKGLNLATYNKNVNLDVSMRHLLDPVKSNDSAYITRKIKEQLKGTSATVILIGKDTAKSDWVAKEIEWSREKGNALVGIRIEPGAAVPEGLTESGAEILDWANPSDVQEFAPAIERAIRGTSRGANMPTNSIATCRR
ncbi:TIR domain-containing protein [Intrasporangium sp. YIM S08009]|uniref:TIR domain-containing protein n=1 Tax=Intrasporangium zincisolvens TaxID=3080018 RepID=UPI002B05773A|nr:TIR domain-containing protein [Intrasporangium sp. YIM S08009]